jgi:hypothetical protein
MSFNFDIPYFNQDNEKKLTLGLEIWQIFIVLTLILTTASSLMWFTNLQPQSFKQEYLIVDKTKSEIYNQIQATKTAMENVDRSNKINKTITTPCYSDTSIDQSSNKDLQTQIISYEKNIDQILINLNSKISGLKNSEIISFAQEGLNYVVESKTDLEKTDIYTGYLQKVQQESIKLCQATLENVNSYTDSLTSISKNPITSNYETSLNDDVKNLIQTSILIQEKVKKDGVIDQEYRKSFIESLIKIVTFRPTAAQLLSSSQIKYRIFMNKLEEVENWQKGYLQNNDAKNFPTVWVLTKNQN